MVLKLTNKIKMEEIETDRVGLNYDARIRFKTKI